MAVLLQYNEQYKMTLQQLQDNTGNWGRTLLKEMIYVCLFNSCLFFVLLFLGISNDNLLQILSILFKVRLLVTTDDENQLQPESIISLFAGFKKWVLEIMMIVLILIVLFLYFILAKNCASTSISHLRPNWK